MSASLKSGVSDFIKKLENRGATVELMQSGHYKASLNGAAITFSATPSDRRALHRMHTDARNILHIDVRLHERHHKGTTDPMRRARLEARVRDALDVVSQRDLARLVYHNVSTRGLQGPPSVGASEQALENILRGRSITLVNHNAIASALKKIRNMKKADLEAWVLQCRTEAGIQRQHQVAPVVQPVTKSGTPTAPDQLGIRVFEGEKRTKVRGVSSQPKRTGTGTGRTSKWPHDRVIAVIQEVAASVGHTPSHDEMRHAGYGAIIQAHVFDRLGKNWAELVKDAGLTPRQQGVTVAKAEQVPEISPVVEERKPRDFGSRIARNTKVRKAVKAFLGDWQSDVYQAQFAAEMAKTAATANRTFRQSHKTPEQAALNSLRRLLGYHSKGKNCESWVLDIMEDTLARLREDPTMENGLDHAALAPTRNPEGPTLAEALANPSILVFQLDEAEAKCQELAEKLATLAAETSDLERQLSQAQSIKASLTTMIDALTLTTMTDGLKAHEAA